MKNIIFTFLIIVLFSNLSAQSKIDSLKNIWENTSHADSVRFNGLYDLIKVGYLRQKPDSAIVLAYQGELHAQKVKDSNELTRFMKVKAIVLYNKGEMDSAINLNNQILAIQKRLNKESEIESTYGRIGQIYFYKSEFDKALEYGLRKLAYDEKRSDLGALAKSYNNVGAIYKAIEDYEKALDYYLKTLNLYQEIKDTSGFSSAYSNIATIYTAKKDFVKAMEFNKKSLSIREALDDKYTMVISYFNIALNYKSLDSTSEFVQNSLLDKNSIIITPKDIYKHNLDQASIYFEKAVEASKALGNDFLTAVCFLGYGELEFVKENYDLALLNIQKGYDGVAKIGNQGYMSEALMIKYKIYKAQGDNYNALTVYEEYIALTDSISSEENLKGILDQEYKYNYEKQTAIDSIKHNEAEKLKQVEIEKQQVELKAQNIRQYVLFLGLIAVIIFSIYFIRKNKEVKAQKQEVEKQKDFAEEQQQIAENQKSILGQQHREITDSINYAQNLQRSVLPSKNDINQNFQNNFILFKPKDVVSGDFYWTYKKGEVVYLAVVDCTGHGVPGAFMTIVANNLLNEIVKDNFNTPKEIVEELHLRIKLRVGGHENAQVRDSMDLGLFSYNKSNKEVKFVGTHTSIYRVRNSKLEKFKGSKADIGYKPTIQIEEQVFQVEPNDMLYFHTDGYPDQKGGSKGKKLYYKPIRDKFEEISLLNLMEQEQLMSKTFDDWKGDKEQFDDVCMIGVRI